MFAIRTVNHSELQLLEPVRILFRAYADFLRQSGGHQSFRYDQFEQEISALPGPYVESGGELLAAVTKHQEVAGCIAFRAFPEAGSTLPCCELKRLFVRPEYRRDGLAKALVQTSLEHARSAGYVLARLDTHPATMPRAHRLYLQEGFTEYHDPDHDKDNGLVFLQRVL